MESDARVMDIIADLEKLAEQMDTRKFVNYSSIPRGMYTTAWWAIQEILKLRREVKDQQLEAEVWKDHCKKMMRERLLPELSEDVQ